MSTITSGNYYRFQSYSDGKYLNILTSGSVTNNKNVTTYSLDTSDNCQVWKCISHSNGTVSGMLMKSKQNENFSLDRYRGSSNYNNTDVYTTGTSTADLQDQLVTFVSATQGYYRIKLAYADLYLTVTSTNTTGGHNVKWQAMTGNSDQLWLPHLYTSQGGTSSSYTGVTTTVPSALANHTWFVKNYHTGKNLNVHGNDTVENERNVNVYDKENCLAQKWRAVNKTNGAKLITSINSAYAINIHTTDNNCTMYPERNNDYDSVIQFIPYTTRTVSANENIYYIKMANHNRYLAAQYTGSGSNVQWESNTNGYCLWKFMSEQEMFAPEISYTEVPDELEGNECFVQNYYTGKYLNVYGNDTVSNGTNVTVYDLEDVLAQRWIPVQTSAGAKITTKINQSFALNINRDSNNNCTMFTAENNDRDSVVEFIPYITRDISSDEHLYYIKLASDNKYLSAQYTGSNQNVRWDDSTSGYCVWRVKDPPVYLRKYNTDFFIGAEQDNTINYVTADNAKMWMLKDTAYGSTIHDYDNPSLMLKANSSNIPVLSSNTSFKNAYYRDTSDGNHVISISNDSGLGRTVSSYLMLVATISGRVFLNSVNDTVYDSFERTYSRSITTISASSNVPSDITGRYVRIKHVGDNKYLSCVTGNNLSLTDSADDCNIWKIFRDNEMCAILSVMNENKSLYCDSVTNSCVIRDYDRNYKPYNAVSIIPCETEGQYRIKLISQDKYLCKTSDGNTDYLFWSSGIGDIWEFESDPYIIVEDWLKLHYNPISDSYRLVEIPDYAFSIPDFKEYEWTDVILTEYITNYENIPDIINVTSFEAPTRTVGGVSTECIYRFTDRTAWGTRGGYTASLNGIQTTTGPHGAEMDENKMYYVVAVGPKVLIPNTTDNARPQKDDYVNNNILEAAVEKNGISYYVRCIVGDVKAHTWNNGVFQTGFEYWNNCTYTPNTYDFNDRPYESVVNPYTPEWDSMVCIEFLGSIEHGYCDFTNTNSPLREFSISNIRVYT